MQLKVHKSLNDTFGMCCDNTHMGNAADKNELSVEIGKRLSDARKALGFTLGNVCDKLDDGSAPSKLSNYEHGNRELPIALAKKLAPILKVSANHLLTLEEPQQIESKTTSVAQIDKVKDFVKYAEELNSKQFIMLKEMASHFVSMNQENQKGTLDFTELLWKNETRHRLTKRMRDRNKAKVEAQNESSKTKSSNVSNITEQGNGNSNKPPV